MYEKCEKVMWKREEGRGKREDGRWKMEDGRGERGVGMING